MDTRTRELIREISQAESIDQRDLASSLGVSVKTVRQYVSQANDQISGCAEITYRRGIGYRLTVSDQPVFMRLISPHQFGAKDGVPADSHERIGCLIVNLVARQDWTTLEALSQALYASRTTLSIELKKVQAYLRRHNLKLIRKPHYGLRVEGSEIARRLCLAEIMSGVKSRGESTPPHDLISVVERVSNCISSSIDPESLHVRSASLQSLFFHIALAVSRISTGNYVFIRKQLLDKLSGSDVFPVARNLANAIDDEFDIVLPEEEVAYLAIHLSGKQTSLSLLESSSASAITEEVWDVVSEMLGRVREIYHIDFNGDLELRLNLARHIMPLSVRLEFNIPLPNPVLSGTKLQFPIAFSMAVDACTVLVERYGGIITEEEIGFVALPFGLALERRSAGLSKKRILVACASGAGSAKLLEYRYWQEFGPYVDSIEVCDVAHLPHVNFTKIDYVFTTVPLPMELPVPVREVEFFLDAEEIRSMKDELADSGCVSELLGIFSQDLFFSHLGCTTSKEVLSFLCKKAAERRSVPSNFEELVWERELIAPSAFGNAVAMPHPSCAVTHDTFVCVAVIENPVIWNACPVRVVLLVSVSADVTKNIDHLYKAVSRMLTSSTAVHELIENQTFERLLKLLSSQSGEHSTGAKHATRAATRR